MLNGNEGLLEYLFKIYDTIIKILSVLDHLTFWFVFVLKRFPECVWSKCFNFRNKLCMYNTQRMIPRPYRYCKIDIAQGAKLSFRSPRATLRSWYQCFPECNFSRRLFYIRRRKTTTIRLWLVFILNIFTEESRFKSITWDWTGTFQVKLIPKNYFWGGTPFHKL